MLDEWDWDAGDERESRGLTALPGLDLFIPLLFCFEEVNLDDLHEMFWSFFATFDFEETVIFAGLVFIACDSDVLLSLDLETFDLEALVLWVLERLRLLRCFISDSELLHLVFDLDCAEMSGLVDGGGRGRVPAGTDPNTPNRVEGPAAWCLALLMDTRCWEAPLFREEDRVPPKFTISELHNEELDTCELALKLEKELEVDLVMLEVITWVVRLPPTPPPPEELHAPTRLLLSIFI